MKTKTLTPQQAIDATKRKQYVNEDVVKTMPPSTFDEWSGDREVGCYRYDGDWYDDWFLAASPKVSELEPESLDSSTGNLSPHPRNLDERLENYEEDENGCWNWNGSVSNGYGLIKVHSRSTRVHRLMYEVFIGPIPEGLVIDHLCRNKKCVNPEHLEAVTSRENTMRGSSPIATQAKQKTCKKGHELIKRADGHRECKTCRKNRKKNHD